MNPKIISLDDPNSVKLENFFIYTKSQAEKASLASRYQENPRRPSKKILTVGELISWAYSGMDVWIKFGKEINEIFEADGVAPGSNPATIDFSNGFTGGVLDLTGLDLKSLAKWKLNGKNFVIYDVAD